MLYEDGITRPVQDEQWRTMDLPMRGFVAYACRKFSLYVNLANYASSEFIPAMGAKICSYHAAKAFYEQAPATDKNWIDWPESYHEIPNKPSRVWEKATDEAVLWFGKHAENKDQTPPARLSSSLCASVGITIDPSLPGFAAVIDTPSFGPHYSTPHSFSANCDDALSDVSAKFDDYIRSLEADGVPDAPSAQCRPLQEISSTNSTLSRPPTPSSITQPSSSKRRGIHVNGFAQTPTPPPYKPYAAILASRAKKIALVDQSPVPSRSCRALELDQATQPLSNKQWKNAEGKLLAPGKTFRPFQVKATEALLQWKDVKVVVSTGMGKSLLFVLPLLFMGKGVSIVVTPLRSLAKEQVQEATSNETIPIKNIINGQSRVIFCCPEMLECPTFAPILHSSDFLSLLNHLVMDEAHCIVEMGPYQPSYGRVCLLRPLLRNARFDVPILQLSAILPPHYWEETSRVLNLKSDSVLINLGNHCAELSTVVLELDSDCNEQLAHLVCAPLKFPGAEQPEAIRSTLLPKVIVSVDDVKLITLLVWFLQESLHKRGYSRDTVCDDLITMT
ncbi:hypothetical protein M407DRAFT_32600 [Tulasnella calospora MUT 4182]|uniref:DNA 3'-5' helicase n=1 Tax=Tulasnella calospora MUT 4182 TaxID=1051891 RepID=A0A0C3Q3P2_9AGAM|nr:hypothetical protein M407DRAFT_32600 [Tulasnella calospora MUT 4182]